MTDTAGTSPAPPTRARAGELESVSSRGLACIERPPAEDGPADGALILLVHGSMDRAASFRRTMRHLPDATVLLYDRRGYGGSMAAPPSSDFTTQVDDLLDVIAGRRVVGVGHSYGGAVVAAAAIRRPDLLDTVVCFEPPQPWRSWWPPTPGGGSVTADADPGDLAESFMRRMVGDDVWQRLPSRTREQRRAEGETLREEMIAIRGEQIFEPRAITVPLISGAGTTGPDWRRRSAETLAEEAPLGRFVEVPGSDHGVHLSHPGALADMARLALARRSDQQ